MDVMILNNGKNTYIMVNGQLLTSPYSPEEENERFYKKIDYKLRNSTIIIFGLGTGKYLDHIAKSIHKTNSIVILEPEKEIVDYFKTQNSREIPENVQIVNIEIEKLHYLLESEEFKSRFKVVYCYMNYRNVYAELYKNIMIYIRNDSIRKLTNEVTIKHFDKEFTKNIFMNYIVNEFDVSINFLKNKYVKTPALIVSGGPSLDKNIKHISDFKGLVFSGGRTINEFMEKKIRVDFMVSVDPGNPAYELIEKSSNKYTMPPLFTYIESNYKVVEKHNNIKILMNSASVPLNDFGDMVDIIPNGPSVANVAVAIAEYLGCDPIVLVGQDLAYTDGKHHSNIAVSSFDKNPNANSLSIEVDGFFGEAIKTTATFYSMLVWFENWIAKSKKSYFNCTEGGVWISGCTHMKLADYLEEFNNSNAIDLDLSLEESFEEEKFKIRRPASEYYDKLNDLKKNIYQAVHHSNKIIGFVKNNNESSIPYHISKLDKIDALIKKQMKNDTMLNYLFSSARIDFNIEKSKYLENDNLSKAKSNMKFYESLYNNLEYLVLWFEEINNETDN